MSPSILYILFWIYCNWQTSLNRYVARVQSHFLAKPCIYSDSAHKNDVFQPRLQTSRVLKLSPPTVLHIVFCSANYVIIQTWHYFHPLFTHKTPMHFTTPYNTQYQKKLLLAVKCIDRVNCCMCAEIWCQCTGFTTSLKYVHISAQCVHMDTLVYLFLNSFTHTITIHTFFYVTGQTSGENTKTLFFLYFIFFHFDIGILFWEVWHISKLVFLVQNDYIKKFRSH